jgi:hypothetical protein
MITLLVVLAGGAAVGAIVVAHRAREQRTAAMRAAAARLGWDYRAEVPFPTIPDLDRFELFTQGRRRKLTNVLTSPGGDPRAVVFDYVYVTGGGNSRRSHRQTVFYGVSDALALPTFSLRPQHFFHGIAKAFGYQDIDLERRPLFSEMFLLRGDDERRVRGVFEAATVVEFFESRQGVCAAGSGREVLYWRPGKRARPDEIGALVEDGFELTRRLL